MPDAPEPLDYAAPAAKARTEVHGGWLLAGVLSGYFGPFGLFVGISWLLYGPPPDRFGVALCAGFTIYLVLLVPTVVIYGVIELAIRRRPPEERWVVTLLGPVAATAGLVASVSLAVGTPPEAVFGYDDPIGLLVIALPHLFFAPCWRLAFDRRRPAET